MRTLVAIPCMDHVHTLFMQSVLGMRKVGEVHYGIMSSSLVYDSRNNLSKMAVEGGYDRVLWLDSDMVFPADTMEKLSARLDEGKDIVSGIYFTRKNPVKPVIYDNCGYFQSGEKMLPTAHAYMDYPRDSIFEVEGFGFGCVMCTTDLLKRVIKAYGMPFSPVIGFGEDLSFCGRIIDMGEKLWCDSSVKCGHIAQSLVTESSFLGGDQNA